MVGLPGFTPDGLLPPGDYELTLEQLRASLLVVGPSPRSEHWDEDWRRSLGDNLGIIVHQLWIAGVGEIFADGSFCEDKDTTSTGTSSATRGKGSCPVSRTSTGIRWSSRRRSGSPVAAVNRAGS